MWTQLSNSNPSLQREGLNGGRAMVVSLHLCQSKGDSIVVQLWLWYMD